MKCDSRGQYSFVRRNEFPGVKSSHPIKPTMLTISHYPPNALAIAASDANDELSWSSLFCEFRNAKNQQSGQTEENMTKL